MRRCLSCWGGSTKSKIRISKAKRPRKMHPTKNDFQLICSDVSMKVFSIYKVNNNKVL